MNSEQQAEIVRLIREAQARSRGYADFFLWSTDRDLEEWGVTTALAESMSVRGEPSLSDIKSRGRQSDPPDCEAKDAEAKRVAIEVTELVDGLAIHHHKKSIAAGVAPEWAEWSQEKFLAQLSSRLDEKDKRFPHLKDAPYPDGYFVLVHTDESELRKEVVAVFLEGFVAKVQHIKRAFLLLSYDPSVEMCPYFEVRLGA
ncbi:hypothetical protein [Xanthomonas tesorieronis]|uniref:hypothetical protein n=1 Tax=Xanthomonas tesorieronis TaxID=3160839 RepID=UPI0035159396